MSVCTTYNTKTQNGLLLKNLMEFYENKQNLTKMMKIINGGSRISLRIMDWFATNYSKKYFTVYDVQYVNISGEVEHTRFKVYNDYKLKLKAYSKKLFDPFCRWGKIVVPFDNEKCMETTLGQLNFFKWSIENNIIEYIEKHHKEIEDDMNSRNSTSKRKQVKKSGSAGDSGIGDENVVDDDELLNREGREGEGEEEEHYVLKEDGAGGGSGKTRKKREELSVSACKCIKKETVKIVVKFTQGV